MIKAHKVRLNPTKEQEIYFCKAAGIARFAYNWALAEWKKWYEQGKKTNEAELRKYLNHIKEEQFPWMLQVTKSAPQQAIKNLGQAFKRFFKKEANYPRFKKKGRRDTFRADNGPPKKGEDAVKIDGNKIKLAIIGWVKVSEKLRLQGQIKSVYIVQEGNDWFAAIAVEISNINSVITENQGIIGVDLGITTYATLSTGEKRTTCKPYNGLLSKLRRSTRRLSKCKKGSQNYGKVKKLLRTLYQRITNIRIDAIHKLTSYLSRNHSGICIEDLNVRGMLKNRRLARHIMDCSFYEFRRQLKYKCKWYGAKLEIADRFFASSKLCHNCGHKNIDLKLAERHWQCSICGIQHDRDVNAAQNLRDYFIKKHTASSAEIYACGELSAGLTTAVVG